MDSENAHGWVQNAENNFSFDFLEWYHKGGTEFLNHIVPATGDEAWVSFVNAETKEQSKKWMHTHSQNQPKNFKQTFSARKLMATVFWDRKGVQQGNTIMSKVYCRTHKKKIKTAEGHSEQKAWNADIWCSAPPRQCGSSGSCSHLSTAGAFQLGVLWPQALQQWSHSERLPPVYLPEELVAITALQE
jgi:hypothetical protein